MENTENLASLVSRSDRPTGYADSRSVVEEIIAVLHLIAGLMAWQIGWHVFAVVLIAKAAFDTCCAIVFGLQEVIAERRKPHNYEMSDENWLIKAFNAGALDKIIEKSERDYQAGRALEQLYNDPLAEGGLQPVFRSTPSPGSAALDARIAELPMMTRP